jgi:formyltetrahydrofolate deformylase
MSNSSTSRSAILLVHCPDQRGLVATVTQFILANNGNILDLEQHVDAQENIFFMRLSWSLDGFWIPAEHIAEKFAPIAQQLQMTWQLRFSDERLRMAVFVSKQGHCLHDILAKQHADEWPVDIPLIISNHQTLEPIAEKFDVPWHYFPVTRDTKATIEQQQQALLDANQIDFVVLARYMQILSNEFVTQLPNRIINIHHSFLPAFVGARPYHAAFQRGVKLIGATSHYVTPALDAGPIIEQDVVRITHRHSVQDMLRLGRDLEKQVLSRAIWLHINHKILAYNNKTVIFS